MSINATDPPITLGPLVSRHASRLTSALTLVTSTETHPPHTYIGDTPDANQKANEHTHDIPAIDIEHVPVDDDPREWSSTKKHLVLVMMIIAVVRLLNFLDRELKGVGLILKS